jgi:SAM-dependent methyltransferase
VSRTCDKYSEHCETAVQHSIDFWRLEHAFFLRAKARVLGELLATHFGRAARPSLLDVGCGVGRLHAHLTDIAGYLAGTDSSWTSIARARFDNPEVDYRESLEGHVPWADASFDVTLAAGVMHHVTPTNRIGLLREMRRATRAGGLVVLIEHNPWNPLTRLAVSRCPFDADAEIFGAGAARRMLRQASLQHVKSRHFLFFPSAADVAARAEQRIAGLPLGAQYMAWGRA